MIAAFLASALTAISPPSTIVPPPAHVRAGDPVFPDARPALWVVNDHDTVIFLFGTFHALDGQSEWFNDEVMTAFSASEELVLETLVPKPIAMKSKQRSMQPVTQAEPAGAPVGPVAGAGSASFLSTSKLVMSAGRTRGMSTEKGADAVLRQAAEQSGKRIGALESFEFQMNMFSTMRTAAPPPTATPEEAAQLSAALAAVLARLQEAWNRGDLESFAPMLEDMRLRSPDSYNTLFAERNARWAAWIAQRLQQPGTIFVAIGAGHLAGRDSVQLKLAESGIRSARVN